MYTLSSASITHAHIRNLQVLQCKCLNIVINAPWYLYISDKDLEVPFFLTTSGH
jgi:hypothetical protein